MSDNELPESHVGRFQTLNGKVLFVYARTTGQKVLIISPDVIKLLKQGNIIVTPDQEFILAHSYDIQETAAQTDMMLQTTENVIDCEIMDFIIKDGAKPRRKEKKGDAVENKSAIQHPSGGETKS